MELKLRSLRQDKAQDSRFNRTFMELKWGIVVLSQLNIVSFNRTFMELKLRKNPSSWS